MSYIIVTRQPHGGLTAITDCTNFDEPNPSIAEFETREDAERTAEDNPLCQTFNCRIMLILGL